MSLGSRKAAPKPANHSRRGAEGGAAAWNAAYRCYLVVESTLKGSISRSQEKKIAALERELEELKKGARQR